MEESSQTIEEQLKNNPNVDKGAMLIMHATLKISSALSNIDEMAVEKQFVKKIKQDLLNFEEWFFDYSAKQTMSMAQASEGMYIRLIKWLNAYDENFVLSDPFEHQMMLFLARCQSAVNDLYQVILAPGTPVFMMKYCEPVISRLECIFNKGYVSQLNFIGTNDRGFLDVVAKFDRIFSEHVQAEHVSNNDKK